MCGIVGYIGPQKTVDIVIEGLKRLEYRGYDSAGVCFKNSKGVLELHKKPGKIENLIKALESVNTKASACIGHTRWATHGKVNEVNSHPHQNEHLAIVHNGIIENSSEIRKMLTKEGLEFKSDTDSECFLLLLTKEIKSGVSTQEAIAKAITQIEGNSSFVILDNKSEEIFAIKRGAPSVVATSESTKEVFASSDPYALIGLAENLYFPEDEVIVSLNPNQKSMVEFFELDGTPSNRYIFKKQTMNLDVASKGQFEHFMLKEIHEQPSLIKRLAETYLEPASLESLQKFKDYKPNFTHILACGTAWHAGLLIKNFLERDNKIPTVVELASEFRYRSPILGQNDLGLFISQSGETADTLAAQALCKKSGLKTLSIVNTEGSTLFRDSDDNLLIKAGIEVGVASTKAFTLQVLTGKILSLAIKGKIEQNNLAQDFDLLSSRFEKVLENVSGIKKIAEEIYNKKGFIFTGRNHYFPVALEGALKLKEIAYVHAEGYASGELKHGPIALIDEQMVNIAIVGPELYDKTISNIEEVKARRGIIVSIGQTGDKNLEDLSDYMIPIDFNGLADYAPLLANLVCQLLSYYMAKFKGTDIDKPRNLAKSVTVE